MLVPRLRFPGFEDEWRNVSLGEVFAYSVDKVDAANLSTYSYIGVDNMISSLGGVRSAKIMPKGGRYQAYCKGDVLHSNIRPYLKKVWLASHEGGTSPDVLVMRPKLHLCESGFLYYLTTSDRYFSYVVSGSKGSKMPRGDKEYIKGFLVRLPSTREQRRITDFLVVIDERIELQSHKVEKLKTYKRGLVQKIFSQQLRFTRRDGRFYPNWQLVGLREILSMPERKRPERVDRNKIISVKLHLKGVAKNENVDTITLGASYFVRNSGQFVFGKQNIFNGALGIIPKELDGYISSADVPALDIDDNAVDIGFFSILVSRRSFYKQLEKLAIGSGSKRIHEKELLRARVKLPGNDEQQKIATLLSQIDEKITLETEKLEGLKKFKKSLLQRMFV